MHPFASVKRRADLYRLRLLVLTAFVYYERQKQGRRSKYIRPAPFFPLLADYGITMPLPPGAGGAWKPGIPGVTI